MVMLKDVCSMAVRVHRDGRRERENGSSGHGRGFK